MEQVVFPTEQSPLAGLEHAHKPLLVNRLTLQAFRSKATQLLLNAGIQSGCWLPRTGRERFLGDPQRLQWS